MKSLKIAIINEIWTAGATRCARDLERYLSARHTVRYYPRNGKETVTSLLRDLSEFAPEVVHCHSYYGDLPYHFLAKVSHRYPTCFTPHDPRPIGTMHSKCWDCPHARACMRCPLVPRPYRYTPVFNRYFWLRLTKRYTHWRTAETLNLITPSRWLQQRLLATELHRFPGHYIPYGIDLNHFRPISDTRVRLALPLDSPIILYVAHPGVGWNSNDRKGLKFLANAFVAQIVPKYPHAMLLVVGESLVPNHPNVKPAGIVTQDDLPLYYSAADVLAAPSLADNLPYTVLEAMGCGTPVIASMVGGIPEQVEQGVTGHLVPPANSDALGGALLSILGDRETREKMKCASRTRAESLFDIQTFIRRHEKLYRQIVASCSSPSGRAD